MKVHIAPVKERIVTITLTENEAVSLATVCQHIGGKSEESRRGHFDHLKRALDKQGIKPLSLSRSGISESDSLYFMDYGERAL